ncbi:MAG: histidinol-phosphatase [Firmicutes bacterium]|nr:histidinol-phosphatase [Bacillota bacterium]
MSPPLPSCTRRGLNEFSKIACQDGFDISRIEIAVFRDWYTIIGIPIFVVCPVWAHEREAGPRFLNVREELVCLMALEVKSNRQMNKRQEGRLGPLIDYHLHSHFSPDGLSTIDEQCERAAALGFREVCFADHFDFEPRGGHWYGFLDYERYIEAISRAKAKWQGRLMIRKGIELDFQSHYGDQVRDFLAGKEFDFVLGSIHWVDRLSLVSELYEGRSMEEAYGRYFEEAHGAAKTGLYDVIAHLDYIKRYAFQVYGKFDFFSRFYDQIEAILKVMVENGTGLEINTSGLRGELGETLPGPGIVKLYRELGGEIVTIGSDAHCTVDLGSGIAEALALLQTVGFDYVAVFHKREPKFLRIETVA